MMSKNRFRLNSHWILSRRLTPCSRMTIPSYFLLSTSYCGTAALSSKQSPDPIASALYSVLLMCIV